MKKLLIVSAIISSIYASNLSIAKEDIKNKNYDEAISILSEMPKTKEIDYLLAKAYFNRHLTYTDYKLAYRLFKRSNIKDSKYYLGIMYLKGLGVDANIKRGVAYLKEANTGKSLYTLATMYLKGKYTLKNPKEAVKLLEKAAKKGYKKANLLLGKLYLEGKYVEKNLEKGAKLIKNSYEIGNQKAKEIWNKYQAWKYIK
jgi:TPR repeat protein